VLHHRCGVLLMDLIRIYQCFCDRTRLRILHLLTKSPLCVCHFQRILGEPQVKISKHLAYLRNKGMVLATREQNWMIYSLPTRRASELEKNLKCLQDCVHTDAVFKHDLAKLVKLRQSCCEPSALFGGSSNRRKPNAKTKGFVHLRS
jgi:ArsR family transcriptional regulator, arsenate/arsenite/antimonite-responsive transcriptional repressor